jgi:flavin-dependent dehydrogenase
VSSTLLPMKTIAPYDVLVIGGGLAGLTLALQIKQSKPHASIAILERERLPYPEATHKVGESTVEIAAYYFSEVLGLKEHLKESQLRKLGLRLFFTAGANEQIEERLEMGSDRHFAVPTFQIDRGRLENFLAEQARARGISILEGTKVGDVRITTDGQLHQVSCQRDSQTLVLNASWVVDASGRAGILKRLLQTRESSEHDSNAVWFRVKGRVDVDDWCDLPSWKEGREGIYSRWYSTNHLTGRGYWVWLIPLASGYTSIGIVTDPKIHPLSRFRSFEDSMDWLREFEPQCARQLTSYRDKVADYLAIKHYAHKCSRVLSGDRWAITGDAGVFIDPLYSPGSDFVAIQNSFISDVISRDLQGERFVGRCEAYNDIYQLISESFLKTYLGQYSMLGNPRIMPLKVAWDYTIYWGFLAFVAIQGRFCDLELLGPIQESIAKVYALGEETQKLFRDHNERCDEPVAAGMLDICYIPFLTDFNRLLATAHTRETFLERLLSNIEVIERAHHTIREIIESPRPLWNSASELIALLATITVPSLESAERIAVKAA